MAANSQNEEMAADEAREVIDPPSSLKNYVRKTPGGDALDMSVVVKAETALEEISSDFPQWMEKEIDNLRAMRGQIRANGLSDEKAREFFLHLHNLRGQAATLGFPLAGEVAGSLCEVIQNVPARNIPKEIIENHVDAILAIVAEKASGDGNEIARKLVARLCSVTKEYLDYMLLKAS
jgi:chemotaxis protein histidine kinase CheA